MGKEVQAGGKPGVEGTSREGGHDLVSVHVCRLTDMRLLRRGIACLDVGCSLVKVMQERMTEGTG